MIASWKRKFKDVRTLASLCKEAERVARLHGYAAPGSEHFVLAALGSQDGTARNAFAGLGATPEAFEVAIRTQFAEALRDAGIEAPALADTELPARPRAPGAPKVYRAAPSGQALVQRLASAAAARRTRSLVAADVFLAVAQEEFSIAARALRILGITRQQLVDAAGREIAIHAQEQGAA